MRAWKHGRATAGCVLALALATGGTAFADPDSKIDRQVELFERILDDVFVESPNWLVQGQHESRGRYRAGQGARFSIDASLVGHWDGDWWDGFGKHWGDRVVIINDDDDDDDDNDSKSDRETRRSVKKHWMERQLKREERLYSRGKSELIDAVLEYGEVLSSLPDAEFLTIDVDLGNAEVFEEKDLQSLTLKVKMADVRAYSDGKLDEKAMVQRIVVEES